MTTIATNLQAVRARIATACAAAGRAPESVRLLAVSKTWPVADLAAAVDAGQNAFGESYLQEALPKLAALTERVAPARLEWHFIGPLQSNKTRPIAEHFDWVHAVDRPKLAARLSAQRPAECPPLNVCLQVNVSGEATKSGCRPDEVEALARTVGALPRLRLRGLMTLPEPTPDVAAQRARFATLRTLRDALNAAGFALDTLSMGMSDDLEAAIMEGATLVRIGTAIFGARQ